MLASGASLRPVPSATSMVFCKSRSSGWASMSKVLVTWKSWASSRAMEISFWGLSRMGSAMERQAWVKASTDLCAGTHPASKCTSAARR